MVGLDVLVSIVVLLQVLLQCVGAALVIGVLMPWCIGNAVLVLGVAAVPVLLLLSL